ACRRRDLGIYKKTDKIQKAVEQVPGIKEITNEITVSNGSDELAGRALSAIYRDAMFRKYALAADLPVHVIVQNNSVILAGKVMVESERRRAEFLVDAHTAAAAIDNRLVIID
ncbi:MAG TPA: BON domain-containing protein, partial [bacterium]|nr:BON domain-containing protein [bacterium]